MFAQSNIAEPAVLLIIVCEEILLESLLNLLKNLKVRGYTIARVAAQDRLGQVIGNGTDDFTNVEIKAIATKEVSEVVMHTLQKHRGDHRVLVYRQDIEVMVD